MARTVAIGIQQFDELIKKNCFYETLSGRIAFIDPETKQPMKKQICKVLPNP